MAVRTGCVQPFRLSAVGKEGFVLLGFTQLSRVLNYNL